MKADVDTGKNSQIFISLMMKVELVLGVYLIYVRHFCQSYSGYVDLQDLQELFYVELTL